MARTKKAEEAKQENGKEEKQNTAVKVSDVAVKLSELTEIEAPQERSNAITEYLSGIKANEYISYIQKVLIAKRIIDNAVVDTANGKVLNGNLLRMGEFSGLFFAYFSVETEGGDNETPVLDLYDTMLRLGIEDYIYDVIGANETVLFRDIIEEEIKLFNASQPHPIVNLLKEGTGELPTVIAEFEKLAQASELVSKDEGASERKE